MEWLSNVPEILEAVLAAIGALKILSRYTPWKWDDKLFGAAEAPLKKVAKFFPKKK